MGGTDVVHRSLELTGYTWKGLSSSAVKAVQQAGEDFGSWRYQHWPRGTKWAVQM